MSLRTLVAILVLPLSSACATEQQTPLFPERDTTPAEGTTPSETPDDEQPTPDDGTGPAPTDASTPSPTDVVAAVDGSAAP
ncbi:MAG: hypothetical protein KGO50_00005, partial [Myxococcales bacterium]|nr:hypothetical protein [Myxococcales bacterium]